MTDLPTPRVSRRPTLPLIWVVPIVALLVAGWMVARQFRDRGPEITIDFANGSGIEAGRTILEHKGVAVGMVRAVSLHEDLSGVRVRVRLSKAAAALARERSEFWVVHPEVSWSGVRGLETLVNGVRIRVRPGPGATATHFQGLERPPPMDDPGVGRAFVLRAERLNGLSPGAPVYYRDVRVGIVETTRLANDATAAVVRIRIYSPYIDLVRTNSEFWNASGVAFKLGLGGAEFRSNTLQSLLAGGVCFATPGSSTQLAPPALEGTEYYLHLEPNKDWLKWTPRIPIKPEDDRPEASKEQQETEVAKDVLKSVAK